MFILNFEDLAELMAKSASRSFHHRLSQSWRSGKCCPGTLSQCAGGLSALLGKSNPGIFSGTQRCLPLGDRQPGGLEQGPYP